MSCYLRHLKPLLSELDMEPKDKVRRREIDLAVRVIVGKPLEKCPEVWKEVKVWLQDPEKKQSLVTGLINCIKKM
ncbi:MAG: hypothetical protein ACYC0Q_10200 [Eubacteriales bacterium]